MVTTGRGLKRGFSLVEVLVGMFVIVVGIAGVTATIWWGTKRSDTGRNISEASNVARMVVEAIVAPNLIGSTPNATTWPDANSGLRDAPNERRALDEPPLGPAFVQDLAHIAGGVGTTTSDISRYRRNIDIGPQPTSGTYEDALCTLKVTIYWMDDEGIERSVSHELLTTHGKTI